MNNVTQVKLSSTDVTQLIIGTPGPKGDTGPKGSQGIMGEAGPIGPQGDQGPAGQMGLTGLQGPTGTAGPVGPKGNDGIDGLFSLDDPSSALSANDQIPFRDSANMPKVIEAKRMVQQSRINYYPGAGRFTDLTADDLRVLATNTSSIASKVFKEPDTNLILKYNGSTTKTSGHFIHNNSNFGGSGALMTDTVAELLTASELLYGNFNKAYGPTFHVMEMTLGSGGTGTTLDGVSYKYFCNLFSTLLTEIAPASVGVWLRNTSSTDYLVRIISSEVDSVKINAEEQIITGNNYFALTPEMGWTHFAANTIAPSGTYYNGLFSPVLGQTAGDTLEIALPYIIPGWMFDNAPGSAKPLMGITL